jgi:RNA polymerase sigma factor (sigma-70 family)
MGDWQLLQVYARDRSEAAFAELVRLHLDWVYSVALRQVGDPHLAEDVAQSVFVLLARKADALRPETIVGGWLFRTTCHVAAHARRGEQRRKIREATACAMIQDTTSSGSDEIRWQQLAPHLDPAVAALSQADRSAILLRFYEKMPLRTVGERLGIGEEAAKKRVSRAVEKLREYLSRRGVKLGGGLLAAVLAEKTVQTASAALGGTVIKSSLAYATTMPQLAHETLRAWRWARMKLAAGLATGSLALIFMVANTDRWLGPHGRTQLADANRSLPGNVGTVAATPGLNNPAGPASNNQVSTPRKTGAITGQVLDELGRPVANAKVWGGFNSQPYAQDTTDDAGWFGLDKAGAPAFVTVTADGFAADQQQLDSTNAPAPLTFRLNPSRPLLVRVVDENGQGIVGAGLFLANWWGSRGTLGQYVPQKTDVNGRLQWPSAPMGEMQMEFIKAGYRYSRTNKLFADGKEHTIILHPTATVTGSVTDAETGAPITNFKFTMGHSQPWIPDDPEPMWDFRGKIATNGMYKIVIEEEQVPFLRIEADNYETVETKIELTNTIETVRNFQLKGGSVTNSIRGTVLLPDGSPAAGVEVALCTANVGVMLDRTAFEPGAFGNIPRSQYNDYRRKTDAQGAFSFDPKPGAHTVVAVGPAGLGQVRCFDFAKPLVIRLQPWGRIEGTVRTRDGHWGGRTVKWRETGRLTSWYTLFLKAESYATRSDANGGFALEHIPPGDGRVVIEDDPGTGTILSEFVEVKPGETAQAQIGGAGWEITGKLIAPPGVEIRSWTNQVTLAQLQVAYNPYPFPEGLTGSAAERWKLEFEESPAGRSWFRGQCTYNFKVGEDGAFTIPEVLPGNYSLFVHVAQGSLGSGRNSAPRYPGMDPQIAFGGKKLTVPAPNGSSAPPMDLGEIKLFATH